jgi:choline-glycine betaine transporter
LTVWAIWAFSEYVLLAIALTYLISGLLLRLSSRLRPRSPAHEEGKTA